MGLSTKAKKPRPIRHTAYLVATLTPTDGVYTVTHVGVYSFAAGQLTAPFNGTVLADICRAEGTTFEDAAVNLIRGYTGVPGYRWFAEMGAKTLPQHLRDRIAKETE